jgi:hypothetical protein
LKKAWVKPTIVTYDESKLLKTMYLKSQTFVDQGYTDASHVDVYTDSDGSAPGQGV